jgi:hypothetical protein
MSAAGDLTFEKARASLGANAAKYTDDQIEAMRQTANTWAREICAAYRRQRVETSAVQKEKA